MTENNYAIATRKIERVTKYSLDAIRSHLEMIFYVGIDVTDIEYSERKLDYWIGEVKNLVRTYTELSDE